MFCPPPDCSTACSCFSGTGLAAEYLPPSRVLPTYDTGSYTAGSAATVLLGVFKVVQVRRTLGNKAAVSIHVHRCMSPLCRNRCSACICHRLRLLHLHVVRWQAGGRLEQLSLSRTLSEWGCTQLLCRALRLAASMELPSFMCRRWRAWRTAAPSPPSCRPVVDATCIELNAPGASQTAVALLAVTFSSSQMSMHAYLWVILH